MIDFRVMEGCFLCVFFFGVNKCMIICVIYMKKLSTTTSTFEGCALSGAVNTNTITFVKIPMYPKERESGSVRSNPS